MNPLDRMRSERREQAGVHTTRAAPVVIGMPAVDWLWTDAFTAICTLMWAHAARTGAPPGLLVETGGTTIAAKRNAIVRGFLKSPAEWLLWLDSDMVPPPDVIQRLVARNLDVVSALMFRRVAPYGIVGRYMGGAQIVGLDPAEPLIPAEDLGTGCLLVRRRVFEAVGDPWFESNDQGIAEDTNFTHKAHRAGFDLWIDTSVEVEHLGVTNIDKKFLTTPMWRSVELTGAPVDPRVPLPMAAGQP